MNDFTAILAEVQSGKLSAADAAVLLQAATPAARKVAPLELVITPKGCVQLKGDNLRKRYGGVILYGNEWFKVLSMAKKIEAFIEANRDKLSWKNADEDAKAAA